MNKQQSELPEISARLSVFDGISIIVGIVVGVSIFKVPPIVFGNVANPWIGLAVWLFAGVLCLVGALCYAELATTYPRTGGDYVYLTLAYGRPVGFLFGWAQLAVILTSSSGAMAYVFADYGVVLGGWDPGWGVMLAAGSVIGLSLLNLAGITFGKMTQNFLTVLKIVGLAGILVAGFCWGQAGAAAFNSEGDVQGPGFGLAMILVLYAYGGWNDAAFVAAEVRDRQRNIPRVLLLGTGGIVIIYLLVNAAFLWGLGFDGLRKSPTPAADVLAPLLGDWGVRGMSLLVMVSALGAVNGLILTGSRVYAALGADHGLFAMLGRWHRRLGVPIWSILAQLLVTLAFIVGVGTQVGRDRLDEWLVQIGANPLPWDQYGGGFDTLVAGTAPVFWLFFLMTGFSLFILRFKDADTPRAFRVPLFPVIPLIFCSMCGYMLYASVTYAKGLALLGIAPLAVGIPLYAVNCLLRSVNGNSKATG